MRTLAKHFKAVTKSSPPGRPILQAVHFDAVDGCISATDSHRLLQVFQEVTTTQVLNLESLEVVEGFYPDTSRLIPTPQFTSINPEDVDADFLKLLKALGKTVIKLMTSEIGLTVQTKEGATIKNFPVVAGAFQDSLTLLVNAKYLYDTFAFIADAYRLKFYRGPVTVTVSSSVRPVLFASEFYNYLITPVRP